MLLRGRRNLQDCLAAIAGSAGQIMSIAPSFCLLLLFGEGGPCRPITLD
jgi:hypothetical protein